MGPRLPPTHWQTLSQEASTKGRTTAVHLWHTASETQSQISLGRLTVCWWQRCIHILFTSVITSFYFSLSVFFSHPLNLLMIDTWMYLEQTNQTWCCASSACLKPDSLHAAMTHLDLRCPLITQVALLMCCIRALIKDINEICLNNTSFY